ncbi:right-handed parallel beta-helix repeat-containing protein [Solibacillus silvestris]|uniref:right-handed parallel beta-helix repeat-containing protein n=1 Tax=Solibacillus silvestris TaxID=76853 RepID=UPI003F7D8C21
MKIKSLVLVCSILFAFLFSGKSFAANTLYVSPNGDDHHNGDLQNPFKTIQHAVNSSSHGDTIFVRQGTYYELIAFDNFTTSSDHVLTIQPFNKEKVIIDGSKRDEDDSARAAFSIRDSENIHIQGFEIRNITTDDDDFYPAGILIRGKSKNIQLSNNRIHNIANFNEDGNAHGILVYGNDPAPIQNIKIRKNHLYDLKLGSSESLTLSGNITNFLIDRNHLYNNNNIGIDIAGFYDACTESGCIDQARNGIISNNRVTNHSSKKNPSYNGKDSAPGIYIDGGKNVKIMNNFVANNNFGISVSSENRNRQTSNITIEGNTIKHNEKAGIVIGGSNIDNGGSKEINVKNNRFIANDTNKKGYYEITLQQNIEQLTLQNNTYSMCRFSKNINNVSKSKLKVASFNEKVQLSLASCLK